MKKLLGLLGTILITGNAPSTIIAVAPNRKQTPKTKLLNSEFNYSQTNNLENLQRSKRQSNEDISTTPKIQDEQQSQSSKNTDSQTDIIEKEINLNENYADNTQKMLKDFVKNNQIDSLRMINNEGIVATDYFETETKIKERDANIKIIEKLEKILELKKFDANKIRILVLTLKNKNNKIRLIINLRNFYVLGFINSKNHYFYFDDGLVKREKDKNKEKIEELENIKNVLEQLNKLIKEKSKDNTKKENLEWKIKERLNKLKILEQWKEDLKKAKTPEEIKKIEENIKDIDKIIKEDVNKAKELDKLKKELIEARKEKNKDKVIEINQKIEKLNKEILVSIPAVNYNNDKKYLDNKIKNLQGEGLKKDEDEIKSINAKVSKKCSIKEEQKHNLGYTGAYQPQGLNAVNQNIIISQKTLKDAIANLSDYTHGSTRTEEEIQTIKDKLARLIFITSEAMRFGSYLKCFNYEKNGQKVEFKNISTNVQKILDDKIDSFKWKDYEDQLIGGWIASSKFVEEHRKAIFKRLNEVIDFNSFELKNAEKLNEILDFLQN